MSPMFLRAFKKENKCAACSAEKKQSYSLCPRHLVIARDKFRAWSQERRALGKCMSCDRKSYKGYLRCKKHTEMNRERCRAWAAKHGKQHARHQWLNVKKVYIAQGLCPSCREHRPCDPGFSRCATCRERRRAISRGELKPWQGTYHGTSKRLEARA